MAGDHVPQNRRERRAAAREKDAAPKELRAEDIPMKQPDRSGPKSKTLFELADERQALLDKGQPFDSKYEDGQVRDEEGNVLSSPLGPFGDAVFFTLTLAMLHTTLDVLVFNQYRQEIEWQPIFSRTATMIPVLFVVIYSLRSDTASRFPVARQIFYLCMAVLAGCHMIYVGNTFDYYAVMKRAPPIGTLWVWSVIEMQLPYAVTSLVIDGAYLWWNGFSAF